MDDREMSTRELQGRLFERMIRDEMERQRECTCPTCGHVMDEEEYANKLAREPKD